MLLVLRCLMFVGVCVEFVAAVAWLAELFPEPARRERVLGYTQAFSSLGGLMVATANGLCVAYAASLPAITGFGLEGAIKDPHAAWRYTLISGVIPAIPLIIIRPFLPESPAWQAKRAAGTLRRPSLRELFSPELRWTTIVTTIMFACSYGAAFGAIQQMPQIVPGLPEVKQMANESGAEAVANAEKKAAKEGKSLPAPTREKIDDAAKKKTYQAVAADVTKVQEFGGLLGRFLLAILAVRILSRRALLRVFQLPGLVVVPLVFYFFLRVENRTFFVLDLSAAYLGHFPVTTVSLGVFLAGLFTVAQFSFWGN